MRRTLLLGLERVGWSDTLRVAAYNLVRFTIQVPHYDRGHGPCCPVAKLSRLLAGNLDAHCRPALLVGPAAPKGAFIRLCRASPARPVEC